ncbi:MAG: sigma-70 family RNA polymerase sigma factor [Acutalibacteraceae bacterium]
MSSDDFVINLASLNDYFSGGDNAEQLKRAKKMIKSAMEEELTPLQRETLTEYYFKGKTMAQIAREQGINKATVSRTVKRARENIKKVLKYSLG